MDKSQNERSLLMDIMHLKSGQGAGGSSALHASTIKNASFLSPFDQTAVHFLDKSMISPGG